MDGMSVSIEKQNMRLSLILWTVLCSACMVVMLWYASHKAIVIADVSQEQTGLSMDTTQGHGEYDTELILQWSYSADGDIYVPLPKGIRPEQVSMENRYVDRELWIYIQGGETAFYEDNHIYGNVTGILEGCSEAWEDGIVLKLIMSDVEEYRSTLDGNLLTIQRSDPHDLYDFVVVLDPAGGGSEVGIDNYGIQEKVLTLEVARQVQRNLSMSNVRLYLTRTEDIDVDGQTRADLAAAVRADLYIRITTMDTPEDTAAYGIRGSYNEEYFIPDFGNADLADIVTRQVTMAVSNRAVGLVPAEEDSILRIIGVPAMELSVGYLSNSQEGALLKQETYREKLAEGIIDAISEACDTLEQLREE